MRTFLITGGCGFIGSHLSDALLAAGHRVIALDDFSTGQPGNVAHLNGHPHFECVTDSVLNRSRLAELIARADAVFHLAAAVGVRLIVESPVRTIETNVKGTELVLELASVHDTPLLITSSSEVYGKGARVPFCEDDDLVLGNTKTGRWSYACSKALDEFLALAYARERRLRAIVVRLFNTAGPRQTGRYGMVLPTFVRQALANQPITVYGDGTQRRCFCDVNDVVGALIALIDNSAGVGGVFNIGSDEEVTIGELAERVRRLAHSRSEIVHIPYDQAWDEQFEDMMRRIPDLRRIRALIGFTPKTSLDGIIARVIEYERARL
ncbi:MAG TPA: NAD-dependent epimerase/dehydratase family protein [Candidatus Binatia bacterium]|nr:NAD-dependent epimerase/dehydratase family protein [Candidatus Binatia bacterium]